MNKPKFLYDLDDPGGSGGDPEDPESSGDPVKTAKDENAGLRAIADSLKDGVRSAIEAARAPVAPLPVQVGPSEATRRQVETEAAEVNTRVNELFAAGQASEALALREQFARKASSMLATDPADSPIIKTAVELGERAARLDPTQKPIMDRWGDEVRRRVQALPPEQRVLPNAWDRAIADTRSAHFDELMNETVNARVEEAKKSFIPPPPVPGSRGSRPLTGAAAKLSEEQLWGAEIVGVSADDYAKELAREEAFDRLPFRERAKFTGIPILDDAGSKTVTPGKF